MNKIECKWEQDGIKTDEDRLINMVHVMAGQLAQHKISGWSLYATESFEDYVKTKWSNGVAIIGAETWKAEGELDHHTYYVKDQPKEPS